MKRARRRGARVSLVLQAVIDDGGAHLRLEERLRRQHGLLVSSTRARRMRSGVWSSSALRAPINTSADGSASFHVATRKCTSSPEAEHCAESMLDLAAWSGGERARPTVTGAWLLPARR